MGYLRRDLKSLDGFLIETMSIYEQSDSYHTNLVILELRLSLQSKSSNYKSLHIAPFTKSVLQHSLIPAISHSVLILGVYPIYIRSNNRDRSLPIQSEKD